MFWQHAGRLVGLALTALLTMSSLVAAQSKELTIWTMGGDQPGWVKWLDAISANFRKSNPGATVKITYYDKSALLVALRTALRAGQGPDIIYTEPDQIEFPDNGYLKALDDIVNWGNMQPWVRDGWTRNGHAWGVPCSAYTNEIYYNKKLMREIGVTLPPNGQVTQAQFLDILRKAKAAGIEPMVLGVGDRPFPGAYLSFEPMLRKLGPADYRKLLDGKLSYSDPRVVEVLKFVKEIVDLGALPKSFATMSLTDTYAYFFNRRVLMFPQGTWYTQRAFAPPERGGQPKDFEVGIMTFPAMDNGACNNCKTLAIGGGYAISADTKNLTLAAGFLKELGTPEMGTLWVVNNFSQSGIKFDASKVTGPHTAYFQELERMKEGAKFFVGIPLNFLSGQCREAFVQVINVGLPAGLVSVDDAVKRMNAACYKGP
jgi:multiple sugar transport system substrate-binding protein